MSNDKKYTDEQKVYWNIEAPFLYDYVNFANRLRSLQILDNQYKKYNMQQDGKRMYLVLFTELYQKTLEDLSVILLALYRRFNIDILCDYQKKFKQIITPTVYTIINYDTKEATIKNIIDKCSNENDLINKLHINDLDTMNINLILPYLDTTIFYKDLYKNIIFWKNDQEKRFRIYNKIKHGMAIVGNAQLFNNKNKNAPAVIYADKNANLSDHPLIVHSLHFAETEFVLLQNGVIKVSDCIRDLLAIYLCKNYPDFLKKQGFSSSLLFFKNRRPGKTQ